MLGSTLIPARRIACSVADRPRPEPAAAKTTATATVAVAQRRKSDDVARAPDLELVDQPPGRPVHEPDDHDHADGCPEAVDREVRRDPLGERDERDVDHEEEQA